MKVLGISDHLTSGASLVVEGRVVAAVNEERLTRLKMVMGFPWKSIDKVLEIGGVRPQDLDYVAVASKWGHFMPEYVDFSEGAYGIDEGWLKNSFLELGGRLSGLRGKVPYAEQLYYHLRQPAYARRRGKIRQVMRDHYGIACPVEFVWHHYAHAIAAYQASGFEDALVVTLDGSGDGHCSHVYDVRAGQWRLLHAIPSIDGLGNYYAYVTQIAGFKAGKHEGKITGLSAHGRDAYRNVLQRFIRYQDGTTKNVANAFRWTAMRRLRSALPDDFKREDLACSIQMYCEEMCKEFVAYWLCRTGHRRVALAGGVAANVRINQCIHELPEVDELFVYPAMSDEGLPAGAALAVTAEKRPELVPAGARCFAHVYLGPEYSHSEMLGALRREGVDFQRPAQPEQDIAELIATGYVVARFNGAMEYGPRALGNRSILYRPDDPTANDWLNKRLKRTEFMPFAPATLAEAADACFLGLDGARDTARFMTITFNCTSEMKSTCPGVVHVDGTARPQIVGEHDNPSYFRIISEFYKLTGIPAIVNTSFNIHEEPIVCSPEDAIRAFKLGHLDVLAMGPYIAKSADADERVTALRSEPLPERVMSGGGSDGT